MVLGSVDFDILCELWDFLIDHVGKDDKKKAIITTVVFTLLAIALFDVSFLGKRIPTYFCVYRAI